MAVVLRRVSSDNPAAGDINRLIDMLNGNAGGRINLIGDDGDEVDPSGGAVLSSGNAALQIQSAIGEHILVLKSTDGSTIFHLTDAGLTIKGLTATGLTVNGNASITGTLAAGATTLASLGVTGAAVVGTTLSAGATTLASLGVTGAATVGTTLAAGATTLASVGVTGAATVGTTFSVGGVSTLHAVNMTGDLAITGELHATGNVSLGDDASDVTVVQQFVALHDTAVVDLLCSGSATFTDPVLFTDQIGFFGTTPISKQTVTGTRSGTLGQLQVVVAHICAVGDAYGLWTDSTS